jgi:hypothetical protein
MNEPKLLLIPAHGGTLFGEHYRHFTSGKMYKHQPTGPIIYEGVVNRQVADLIRMYSPVACDVWNPGPFNRPLGELAKNINEFYKIEPDLVVLNIHCNAGQSKSAHGAVIFHDRTPMEIEIEWAKLLEAQLSGADSIGCPRGIKEANFRPIYKLKCPALLLEMGFMTNLEDTEFLLSTGGQVQIALDVCQSIAALQLEYSDLKTY